MPEAAGLGWASTWWERGQGRGRRLISPQEGLPPANPGHVGLPEPGCKSRVPGAYSIGMATCPCAWLPPLHLHTEPASSGEELPGQTRLVGDGKAAPDSTGKQSRGQQAPHPHPCHGRPSLKLQAQPHPRRPGRLACGLRGWQQTTHAQKRGNDTERHSRPGFLPVASGLDGGPEFLGRGPLPGEQAPGPRAMTGPLTRCSSIAPRPSSA